MFQILMVNEGELDMYKYEFFLENEVKFLFWVSVEQVLLDDVFVNNNYKFGIKYRKLLFKVIERK